MDIETASGEKVVFIGSNGWPGEAKTALELLSMGEELTVNWISVSQSSSSVTFKEYPNKHFNTVMFKNNTPTWERFDWFAQSYCGVKETTQEEYASKPFQEAHMSDAVLKELARINQIDGTTWSHSIVDLPTEHCESVGEAITAGLVANITPKKPLNKIVTAARTNDQLISVLNPANEQEVIDIFMNQYGFEPSHFYTVHFENTFDPQSIVPTSYCDC